MDSRIRLSQTLLSLISDYEQNLDDGRHNYLDDKEYYQIITYYEDEKEFERALDVLEKAIKQYPYRADFLSAKARVYIKRGLLDAALNIILSAEIISPFEIEIQLLKANIFIHQKSYNDAIVLIEDLKTYATKSDLEDICIAEAFFYESIQEFDLMFQCLKQALILSPNNEEALFMMNVCIDQSKNYEESILLHKVIVENHPYNYLAWFNLGHSYASVGEYARAIDSLEYSFIINPEFETGYLDCAEYCSEVQKYDRALDVYNEALGMFGPDIDLLMNIANCQYSLGLIEQAKRALFEAIELDSYSDEAYFLLAKCYIENENWTGAIKVLKKAITIENDDEGYYHVLAKAYRKLGQTERARFYYKKAAEKGYEQASYWEDYVLYLFELKDYTGAKEVLKRADQYTFSYTLQYLNACSLIGAGEKNVGLRLLEESLEEAFEEHTVIYDLPKELSENKEILSVISYFDN